MLEGECGGVLEGLGENGVWVMWSVGLYGGGLCVECLVGWKSDGGMWGVWKDGRLYDVGLFVVTV